MAYKEKRREKRFDVDMSCTVKGQSPCEMKVLNISKSGIAIWGSDALTDSGGIDLEVDVGGAVIPIRAVVCNVSRLEGKARYGMEIVQSPEQWLDIIYAYTVKSI